MSENALAVVEQGPPAGLSLMEGEPEMAVAYAKRAAAALNSVIVEGSGFVKIQGKKHITIEGWQVLAAATNHSIEVEWSRPMDEPAGAWEARAVVRDVAGNTVAAGEAMASPDEGNMVRGEWKPAPWTRQPYSIRSMAQTRAMSRAASSRLRYIPTLAGFSGTPAEEMPRDEPAPRSRPMTPYDEIVAAGRADGLSTDVIRRTLKAAGIERPKDLEDEAVFKVGMDAVLGVVGGPEPGDLPVADPDAEAVEGEVVDDEAAADAAWSKSKPKVKK